MSGPSQPLPREPPLKIRAVSAEAGITRAPSHMGSSDTDLPRKTPTRDGSSDTDHTWAPATQITHGLQRHSAADMWSPHQLQIHNDAHSWWHTVRQQPSSPTTSDASSHDSMPEMVELPPRLLQVPLTLTLAMVPFNHPAAWSRNELFVAWDGGTEAPCSYLLRLDTAEALVGSVEFRLLAPPALNARPLLYVTFRK